MKKAIIIGICITLLLISGCVVDSKESNSVQMYINCSNDYKVVLEENGEFENHTLMDLCNAIRKESKKPSDKKGADC